MRKHNDDGLTLLELLLVLGIITLIIAVVSPNFDELRDKKLFQNSYRELNSQLSTLRLEALSRGTTSRLQLQQVAGVYVMTAYVSPTPVAGCNPAGAWIQISTGQLELPSAMQIAGSGVGSVCFYRDGSASGGQYDFDDGGAGIGTATLIVTVATGYIDVSATN